MMTTRRGFIDTYKSINRSVNRRLSMGKNLLARFAHLRARLVDCRIRTCGHRRAMFLPAHRHFPALCDQHLQHRVLAGPCSPKRPGEMPIHLVVGIAALRRHLAQHLVALCEPRGPFYIKKVRIFIRTIVFLGSLRIGSWFALGSFVACCRGLALAPARSRGLSDGAVALGLGCSRQS